MSAHENPPTTVGSCFRGLTLPGGHRGGGFLGTPGTRHQAPQGEGGLVLWGACPWEAHTPPGGRVWALVGANAANSP